MTSLLALRWKNYWFCAGVGLAIAGVLMLTVSVRHNARHDWYPLHMSLGAEADDTAEGDFAAELDEFYEIEIQFEERVSWEVKKKLLYPLDESPMSIAWSVKGDGEVVAQGDSLGYSYLETGRSFKRRVWSALLNTPDDYGFKTAITARGIGGFHASKGQRYTIETRVIDLPEELVTTTPALSVRLNRKLMGRHYREKAATGAAGLFALAAAGPCLALWLLAVWWQKRSAP